jgi:hypothetical protein
LASAHEHVPEAERRIRVVKERTRAIRYGLPFDRMPRLMTINMVLYAARMLNYFPVKGGISDTLCPRTLVQGLPLDHKNDFRLAFGDYCQVHEHDTPRNSQAARTQGAICLGPANNAQGGFYFMRLRSGEKITRYSWTLLPTRHGYRSG